MSIQNIVYDVINCSGIIDDKETVACCPFYDNENDSGYCPFGEFFIYDVTQLPKDCPLKKQTAIVRLKID